jgi:hypothetical protein
MFPYPHIDVEPWFVEVVRNYPMACVLKDKIPHPQFLNADFIFHHEKIVAEFKRVEKDGTDNPKVQEKIAAVLEKYHAAGKIKEKKSRKKIGRACQKNFTTKFTISLPIQLRLTLKKPTNKSRQQKRILALNPTKVA